MGVIEWDEVGKRLFETGCDRGVIYPQNDDGTYGAGEAWNGLTGVSEKPTGADVTDLWADNQKYVSFTSAEEFKFTISAYTYPDTFEECNGSKELVKGMKVSQQSRKNFGFSYRTKIGNDVKKDEYGYILHLVYNCLAGPSQRDYKTVNNSPEGVTFSFDVTTTAEKITSVANAKPAAHIMIDSTKVDADKLTALETLLYGTASVDGTLPSPDDVYDLLTAVAPEPDPGH